MTNDMIQPMSDVQSETDPDPARKLNAEDTLGELILLTPWLQLPLTMGLALVVLVLELKFFQSLYELVTESWELTETRTLMMILKLIDMVLIANLLVMIVTSGYKMFIAPSKLKSNPRVPGWLLGITLTGVKMRISATVLLIATIHLLQQFLEPTVQSVQHALVMVGVQIVFVITTCAYAWIDRLERSE